MRSFCTSEPLPGTLRCVFFDVFWHCRDPRLWDPWTLQWPYRPSALTLHQVISRTLELWQPQTASSNTTTCSSLAEACQSQEVSSANTICEICAPAMAEHYISNKSRPTWSSSAEYASSSHHVNDKCCVSTLGGIAIVSQSQSLDSSLLRFVLTCANHPYGGTMTSYQPPKYFFTALLSPPPRGLPHVTTRPSRRTAAKAPLAAWIRWTLTSSACTSSSFFRWRFEVCFNIVTRIVEIHSSNIEKKEISHFPILSSIGKILLNYLHQKLDRPTSQHFHLIWWLQKLLRWELLVEHPPAQEVYDSVVHPMLQQCHHLWWQ